MTTGIQSGLPRIVQQDGNFIAGTFANVGIVCWENDTQVQSVRVVRDMLQRLARAHPQGVGLIQVVSDHHPALTASARAELNALLKAGAAYTRCSTVVFEGRGFRAAAIRGIVAGLVMLARVPFPHQVFATVEAAAEWELAHLRTVSPALSEKDLVGAIHFLRARLRQPDGLIAAPA